MLIKAFYDDTVSKVQALNDIHVSSCQISTRGFECFGSPSLNQIGENVENMYPKSGMRSACIWWCNILDTSYIT
jgi:hypothetical protein